MGIFEAIVLGIVQGITEFLPVSSSGHLVILQKVFGILEPALLFDTMLHIGTLFAVFFVLWKDILKILKAPIQRITGLLIIATIPIVVIALIFKAFIKEVFSSASYIGFFFLVTATALFLAERLSKRAGETKNESEMNWKDALIIGILQGIAIMPGVSRSGLTLSGALSRKLERGFAARFSFLMSIPAILGALVFQLKDVIKSDAIVFSGSALLPIVIGTVTAAIVGIFSVRLMLKIVREKSLTGFAIYVTIIGTITLIDQYITKFYF
ncbi:MAG: undecaprenyl-diphosphate phosphatase [Spirochaetaceae bacterium]|nr:undecaprenyl-diphosphate phosphatase [Spirochaetaceae bacterium]